jgi:hypothetical protein
MSREITEKAAAQVKTLPAFLNAAALLRGMSAYGEPAVSTIERHDAATSRHSARWSAARRAAFLTDSANSPSPVHPVRPAANVVGDTALILEVKGQPVPGIASAAKQMAPMPGA